MNHNRLYGNNYLAILLSEATGKVSIRPFASVDNLSPPFSRMNENGYNLPLSGKITKNRVNSSNDNAAGDDR